jgi:Mn-dependent DtxR family transcriptional regulator
MMLGVRRTSVTEVAGELRHLKLINYSRGRVAILNRSGLERRACECYSVSKREFDRLLGHPLGPRREHLSDEVRLSPGR